MSEHEKPSGGLLSFLPPPKQSAQSFLRTTQQEENQKNHDVNPKKPLNTQSKFASPIYQNVGSKKTFTVEKLSLPLPKIAKAEIQTKVASLCAYSDDSDEVSDEEHLQKTNFNSQNFLISDDKDELPVVDEKKEKHLYKLTEKPQHVTEINKNHPRYMQPNVFHSENKLLFNNDQDNIEDEREEPHVYQKHIIEPDINEILRRECGKRKRDNPENINIIDINVNKIIEQNKEDLLKNMTKEDIRPAKEFKGGKFGAQITYLAQLAKERDQELKAAWAEQKNTRRVSKQRYGF
jgi:hypothetical protein